MKQCFKKQRKLRKTQIQEFTFSPCFITSFSGKKFVTKKVKKIKQKEGQVSINLFFLSLLAFAPFSFNGSLSFFFLFALVLCVKRETEIEGFCLGFAFMSLN